MNPDHALLEFEAVSRLIEPDGVTCVMALAIKSPLTIDELSSIIKRKARYVRDLLEHCARYGYIGLVAPLDATRWTITTKGRALLANLLHHLGIGSDPLPAQLPLPGSDPVGESDSPDFVVARRAHHLIIHSDQIDQNSISESESVLRMNETPPAPRDLQAVSAALDRERIKDLPGKPNRSDLLRDSWITPERIYAAVDRAKHNPLRKSPNHLGLAVVELRAHHGGIDEWIAAHAQPEIEPVEPDQPNAPAEPEPWPDVSEECRVIWQNIQGELQFEMTRTTFETWVKPICVYRVEDHHWTMAVPSQYALEWVQQRLHATILRAFHAWLHHQVDVTYVFMPEGSRKNG